MVKTPDGQSGFVTIGVNSGEPVIVDSVSKRIRLEIAAVREAGGAADSAAAPATRCPRPTAPQQCR